MEKIKAIIILLFSISSYAQIDDFKEVNFNQADSIAKLYKGSSLDNLPLLTYKLTVNLPNDAAKFRAIYTWVSMNIDNDHGSAVKNQRKRKKLANDNNALDKWNDKFKTQVFRKLLKDKKTICTGYAYLVKELSTIANIKCKIIDGYGRNIDNNIGELTVPNHSWNAVFLNNKWYLCDATWSSGYTKLPEYKFVSDYNEGYFLTPPEYFAKNHYPLQTKWLLTKNKPSIIDFLNGALLYGEAFKNDIIPILPKTMYNETVKNRINTFRLKISNTFKINQLKLEISNGSMTKMIKPNKIFIKDNILELTYQFKNSGHYDFHIKSNDDYIATYMFRVKSK